MRGKHAGASTSATKYRTRRFWQKVHRWLGLSFGIILLIAAATGSTMLVADPLDKALNKQLFFVPGGLSVNYRAVLAGLQDKTPPPERLTLRPPRAEGESLQAIVRGDWNGTIFLNPTTGDFLGRRGESSGLMGVLFTLHSSLCGGEAGKALLTLTAFAYGMLFLSGVYLWWPSNWGQAFSIRWTSSRLRALFDWHRVTGAALGGLVLISVASGAYMAWPPLAKSVTNLTGASLLAPPVANGGPPGADAIERAVANALAVYPAALVGYVQVPVKADLPIRVRLRLADDPHPNGLTSVWLHPDSAQIIRVDRWSDLDPGTRAYSIVYPLHTGELWGLPWTILTFCLGGFLSAYGATGLWIWWRRRR